MVKVLNVKPFFAQMRIYPSYSQYTSQLVCISGDLSALFNITNSWDPYNLLLIKDNSNGYTQKPITQLIPFATNKQGLSALNRLYSV